jgi:hypothetical protein
VYINYVRNDVSNIKSFDISICIVEMYLMYYYEVYRSNSNGITVFACFQRYEKACFYVSLIFHGLYLTLAVELSLKYMKDNVTENRMHVSNTGCYDAEVRILASYYRGVGLCLGLDITYNQPRQDLRDLPVPLPNKCFDSTQQ